MLLNFALFFMNVTWSGDTNQKNVFLSTNKEDFEADYSSDSNEELEDWYCEVVENENSSYFKGKRNILSPTSKCRLYAEVKAPEKLDKLFDTLRICMEEASKCGGDNTYSLPHKKKPPRNRKEA